MTTPPPATYADLRAAIFSLTHDQANYMLGWLAGTAGSEMLEELAEAIAAARERFPAARR